MNTSKTVSNKNKNNQDNPKMSNKPKNLTDFGSEKVVEVEPPSPQSIQCLTCCDPIIYYSIGPCNHREVCHKCSIRMRELYKDYDCCICKQFHDRIIISDNKDFSYEDNIDKLEKNKDSYKLESSGIWFSSSKVYKDCIALFDIRCKECTKPFKTMKDLKIHTANVHNKTYCDICVEHRKVFPYEQVSYTKSEIKKHLLHGDPNLHIKPHPMCEYCHKRFYSDEEILQHCEENYFKCFICERDNILYHYFKNYDFLETHFKNKHYLCMEKECLEKKFVAFKTELDLQAHNVKVHLPKKNLSRSEKKQLKTININFNISGNNSSRYSNNPAPPRRSARPIEMPTFFPDQQKKKVDKNEETFNLAEKVEDLPLKNRSQNINNHDMNNPNEIRIIQEDHLIQNNNIVHPPPSNQTIISKIKEKLKGETAFKDFRATSALYRKNKLSASDYYDYYVRTVGKDDECISLLIALVDLIPERAKAIEMKNVINAKTKAEKDFPKLTDDKYQPKKETNYEINGNINTSVWSRNSLSRKNTNSLYGNKPNITKDVEEFPTLQSSVPKKPPNNKKQQQKVIKTVWNTNIKTNVYVNNNSIVQYKTNIKCRNEPQFRTVPQRSGKKGKKMQVLLG